MTEYTHIPSDDVKL